MNHNITCFTCGFTTSRALMMMNGWLIDDLIFSKIASSVRMCFHHSYGIGFMSKRHMPDMRRLNFFICIEICHLWHLNFKWIKFLLFSHRWFVHFFCIDLWYTWKNIISQMGTSFTAVLTGSICLLEIVNDRFPFSWILRRRCRRLDKWPCSASEEHNSDSELYGIWIMGVFS